MVIVTVSVLLIVCSMSLGSGTPSAMAASWRVAFTDIHLEKAVKAQLQLGEANSVTAADMSRLTELHAADAAITSLEGLQHAVDILPAGATYIRVHGLPEASLYFYALWRAEGLAAES
ncbi:hypothetical protein [Paenibacillus sp. YYML68]|uniref:hypothetical protein n=1 Tax=Paenibacillus sp. YYML68 TaxID=2909250 RepID=UPI0024900B45|nr:hypothetical protein [Paenibacillus sp. YYML68]